MTRKTVRTNKGVQEFSRSDYKNQNHFSTPAITNKKIKYLENNLTKTRPQQEKTKQNSNNKQMI